MRRSRMQRNVHVRSSLDCHDPRPPQSRGSSPTPEKPHGAHWDAVGQPHSTPSAADNVDGYLEDRSASSWIHPWKKRFVTLRDSTLCIYRSPQCAAESKRPIRQLMCQDSVVRADPTNPLVFTIISEAGKVVSLRAGWAGARTLWINAMHAHGSQMSVLIPWSNQDWPATLQASESALAVSRLGGMTKGQPPCKGEPSARGQGWPHSPAQSPAPFRALSSVSPAHMRQHTQDPQLHGVSCYFSNTESPFGSRSASPPSRSPTPRSQRSALSNLPVHSRVTMVP